MLEAPTHQHADILSHAPRQRAGETVKLPYATIALE